MPIFTSETFGCQHEQCGGANIRTTMIRPPIDFIILVLRKEGSSDRTLQYMYIMRHSYLLEKMINVQAN